MIYISGDANDARLIFTLVLKSYLVKLGKINGVTATSAVSGSCYLWFDGFRAETDIYLVSHL